MQTTRSSTNALGRVARSLNGVRLAGALGNSSRDRFRLAVYHVRQALGRRVPAVVPRPITVRLAPDGFPVLISDPGELSALHHIFQKEEYAVHGNPRVIFDLGANVGFATLYFSRRFPDTRIVAVEGDPRTYARLVRNVEGLPNVTTLNRAMATTDGPLTFYSSRYSLWSGLTPQSAEATAVQVEGITLDSLRKHVGIEEVGLLKLDSEGAEFDVLRASQLDVVNEIIAEIHYDLSSDSTETDVRNALSGFDMTFVPQGSDRSFLYAHRAA
jgi:FkbM family methyltransferase